jgi:hypothetical protein
MATRKFKRFDGGGDTGIPAQTEDEASNEAALNADLPRRRMADIATEQGAIDDGPDQVKTSGKVFGSGSGTRKPATPSSSSGRKPTPATRSDANYSNEGKGDSKYRKQTMTPESQAIERVYPEQALVGAGGAGIKGVAALAKGLANRGANAGAPALRTISQAALKGPAATKALPAPTKRIGYDKAGTLAKQRAARAEGRNSEMLSENARRSGVKPGSAGAEAMRKNLGGDEWTLGMKRGGSVKKMASGGSTGSFRSSANGIAQRGKTRGKMC